MVAACATVHGLGWGSHVDNASRNLVCGRSAQKKVLSLRHLNLYNCLRARQQPSQFASKRMEKMARMSEPEGRRKWDAAIRVRGWQSRKIRLIMFDYQGDRDGPTRYSP